jgi:hypothetical protein
MSVSRRLVLAVAALAAHLSLVKSAQAAAVQAAELNQPAAVHLTGFYLVEPHKLLPPAPRMVSVGSSIAYGRTASGNYSGRPDAAGALAAFYADGTWPSDRARATALVRAGSAVGEWRPDFNHWQYDETHGNGGDWRNRAGHWREVEQGRHGHDHDHDQVEDGFGNNPPAVPIPATFWLFASGVALLGFVDRAQRIRNTLFPAMRLDPAAAP